MKRVGLILLALFSLSCDLLVGPDPENTPEQNFEILWKEFDRYYSFFEYKGVNWDSLYAVYRPQITRSTIGPELFGIMSSLVSHLRDGHVNIYTPHGTYRYNDWYSRYPENFKQSDILQRYLNNQYSFAGNGTFLYGKVSDDVGYVYIRTFGSGTFGAIDDILREYRNLSGLIIDIRHNGGGNSNNSETVAQRFLDQRRLTHYIRWRNGPKHSDLTDFIPEYLEPGGVRFSKPVVVLTNRRVFSAAEQFVLMMSVLPQVTFVGDTTGGGSGNPLFRELPNGWSYRLSRWQEYSADKIQYEGVGIPPDVPVWISTADSLAGRDTILEAAMQVLGQE